MGVVAAVVYRDGRRDREFALDGLGGLDLGPDEFAWIGLADPTPDEMAALRDRFGLHPLAVEDAMGARQLPKVDVYGDQLFVLARSVRTEGDAVAYGETAIFVGRSHIVTVRHGPSPGHAGLRARLEAAPGLLRHGVDYVLHGVLDAVVDGYLPVVEAIEDEAMALEGRAMDAFLCRSDLSRVFAMRRDLTRLRRTLAPMEELCAKLVHLDLPCLDAEAKPYFKDVHDHVRRLESMAEGVGDHVTAALEVASILEQQRQGTITRRLAAWAAILAVPTAIAGIYGMNFEHMPELRWAYGYPAVLGTIAASCAVLWWRFRRSGWL